MSQASNEMEEVSGQDEAVANSNGAVVGEISITADAINNQLTSAAKVKLKEAHTKLGELAGADDETKAKNAADGAIKKLDEAKSALSTTGNKDKPIEWINKHPYIHQ